MGKVCDIVIFGAGGHAAVIRDMAEVGGSFRVLGFVEEQARDDCRGLPVYSEQDLAALPTRHGVVGIGDNFSRAGVVDKVLAALPEFEFVTVIHPGCLLQRDVEVGPGSVLMPGVAVNTGTRIGAHCIANTGARIDHDCVLEDFVSIAPGAVLGGNVGVGMRSAVSLGAAVAHNLRIGADSVIGTGAVVVEDVDPLVVAYGNPCRRIRARAPGERYLSAAR